MSKSKMFVCGFLLCVMVVLIMGAAKPNYFQHRFNFIVRNKDGKLLVVDVSTAKARYVEMESGSIPNPVIVEKDGWSANHQPEPNMGPQ
jgi:hypothetical protein